MLLHELERRLARPNQFKQNLIRSMRANKAKIDLSKSIAGVSYFDQQSVVGESSVSFFKGAFSVDRTNLENSFTRPESEHIWITRLRILEGASATVTQTDWQEVTTPDILNGDISILVNGVVLLNRIPLTDLKQSQTGNYYSIIDLDQEILWLGQTNLEARVQFPVAPATANQNLRVQVIGAGFIS